MTSVKSGKRKKRKGPARKRKRGIRPSITDPFQVFTEWRGAADERAYASL